MTSNKKVSSLGLALGISLGLASTGTVVNAGSISDSYGTGDTLTAGMMTNIKTAVNGNATDIGTLNTTVGGLTTTVGGHTTSIGTLTTTVDGHTTSIGTLTTDVANLKTGAGTCAGSGVAGDTMVRVGSVCVDKYEAKIVSGVAQSVAGDTPTTSVDWITAARACAKAGKRLLTNAEWQVAATGTPAASCNIPGVGGTLTANNANPACVSTDGVVNMVGNAVEWVSDWDGLIVSTAVLSTNVGVLRGGDATDAIATVEWLNKGIALNSTDPLRGFRCAR